MFAIIYSLFAICEQTIHTFKRGKSDTAATAKAIDCGDNAYIDYYGSTRLVGDNQQAIFTNNPRTGDVGYLIVEKGSDYHKFINTSANRRDAEWKRAHEDFLSGKGNPCVTVIEYEGVNDRKDDPNLVYYDNAQKKYVNNTPRKCIGRRYRDIATGRFFVEREMQGKDKFYYYMDAETGMAVRYSDFHARIMHQIPSIADNLRRKYEEAITEFNKRQKIDLDGGCRERMPWSYYKNSYDSCRR